MQKWSVLISVRQYCTTSWVKKTRHQTLVRVFAKYWSMFDIFDSYTRQEICNKAIITDPTKPQRCRYTILWNITFQKLQQRCGLGLDVSVSRPPRDVLMSRLGQNAQRLGLVSVSDLCVSGLILVSAQKVSAYHLGSWTFSSRRDVSYRRAKQNFISSFTDPNPNHIPIRKLSLLETAENNITH